MELRGFKRIEIVSMVSALDNEGELVGRWIWFARKYPSLHQTLLIKFQKNTDVLVRDYGKSLQAQLQEHIGGTFPHVTVRFPLEEAPLGTLAKVQRKIQFSRVRAAESLQTVDLDAIEKGIFPAKVLSFAQDMNEHNAIFDKMGEKGIDEGLPTNRYRTPEQLKQDELDIKSALAERIKTLPLGAEFKKRLKQIVFDNYEAFCTCDEQCSMSSLTPMDVKVDPVKARQFKMPKLRPMHPERARHLRAQIAQMVRLGIIRPCKNPIYGLIAFVVPKKKPGVYRVVLDMRPINQITRISTLQLPHLQEQMTHLNGARFFGCADIQKAFNYMPVTESARKYLVIITSDGAYEMLGSPMGYTNTPVIFQNRIVTEVL